MDSKRTALRTEDPAAMERARAELAARREQLERRQQELPSVREKGEAALRRLLPIAQRDTGQSSVVARFLLNLYNGNRFPFDMTDMRRLDYEVFDDCMDVLRMDSQPQREVHEYFVDGGKIWEKLAQDWYVRDFANEDWRRAP